jgi:hypothetical protein
MRSSEMYGYRIYYIESELSGPPRLELLGLRDDFLLSTEVSLGLNCAPIREVYASGKVAIVAAL